MKKLYTLIVLFCIAVFSMTAQNEGLVFKGVPIGGTMDNFIRELKTKEFTLIEKTKENALMRGKFAGQEVSVLVMATPANQMVYGVAAILDPVDTWQLALSQYERYKDLYTTKYGAPETVIEHYNRPYGPTSQINHIGLENGAIEFKSIYKTDKGAIIVTINKANYSDFQIALIYRNDENAAANNAEILEDL